MADMLLLMVADKVAGMVADMGADNNKKNSWLTWRRGHGGRLVTSVG